jgi:hypothetical protein
MAQKSFPTYSDPNYTTRSSVESAIMSGNAATFKWVTYAAQYAFSVSALLDTIGTSTYSATTSCQTVSLYIVSNTSTTSTVSLATQTYGPYNCGGNQSPAQAGGFNVNVLNTNTGVGQYGGVYIPQGSEVYFQLGTDATAKVVATMDYQMAPLAPVTA